MLNRFYKCFYKFNPITTALISGYQDATPVPARASGPTSVIFDLDSDRRGLLYMGVCSPGITRLAHFANEEDI